LWSIPVTLNSNTASGGNWTGGNGTFSPNRFTANATYTPASSETGTTITLTWNVPDPDGMGPCSPASDAMTITVSNAIAPNAGPDQILCGATAIQLAANTVAGGNWIGGAGTFNPNRTSANAIYTPSLSENGTAVTLTWNIPDLDGSGPCTATSDAMVITVNNFVLASAGPGYNHLYKYIGDTSRKYSNGRKLDRWRWYI
jgi:hypothetical protein